MGAKSFTEEKDDRANTFPELTGQERFLDKKDGAKIFSQKKRREADFLWNSSVKFS